MLLFTCTIVALYTVLEMVLIMTVISIFFLYPQKQLSADITTFTIPHVTLYKESQTK